MLSWRGKATVRPRCQGRRSLAFIAAQRRPLTERADGSGARFSQGGQCVWNFQTVRCVFQKSIATWASALQFRRAKGGILVPTRRSLVGERFEEERSGLADEGKTLCEDGGVSVPDVDVVAARGARVEANGTRNHKGRSFRFGFADTLRGGAAALSPMQEFVPSS
jgi:hypothetical protein